jgi:phosphoribosylanthranilate isomerase
MFKITTNTNEEYYLQPLNNVIIEYNIIEVKKTKKRFQLLTAFSRMYSVVQFEKEEKKDVIEEIDETMICNDYLSSSYEEEEEEEEEQEDNNKWNHVYLDEEDAILFKLKKD